MVTIEDKCRFFCDTDSTYCELLLVAVAVLRSFWLDLICRNASCGVSNILHEAANLNFWEKYLNTFLMINIVQNIVPEEASAAVLL